MNKYIVKFVAICPINNASIKYTLTIKINKIIYVEDITKYVTKLKQGFHEIFADKLFIKFGGLQKLIANHHNVIIETKRK